MQKLQIQTPVLHDYVTCLNIVASLGVNGPDSMASARVNTCVTSGHEYAIFNWGLNEVTLDGNDTSELRRAILGGSEYWLVSSGSHERRSTD